MACLATSPNPQLQGFERLVDPCNKTTLGCLLTLGFWGSKSLSLLLVSRMDPISLKFGSQTEWRILEVGTSKILFHNGPILAPLYFLIIVFKPYYKPVGSKIVLLTGKIAHKKKNWDSDPKVLSLKVTL